MMQEEKSTSVSSSRALDKPSNIACCVAIVTCMSARWTASVPYQQPCTTFNTHHRPFRTQNQSALYLARPRLGSHFCPVQRPLADVLRVAKRDEHIYAAGCGQ